MVQVQGRRAPWVVEEPRLEMFGEEAVSYLLKRNRTPLTGRGGGGGRGAVIGEQKKMEG